MKKKLLILTALLTFAISAKAPGKTNVTYQVDPSYEVVIPSDATVPFLTEKSAYGTIEIKEAVLEENKCILVKMDASGTLVNEKHPKSKIPYQILNGKKEFKSQKYTKAGEKTTGIRQEAEAIRQRSHLPYRMWTGNSGEAVL